MHHKCSSGNLCRHGGVCENVEESYQCNCNGTDHHGPNCETGTTRNHCSRIVRYVCLIITWKACGGGGGGGWRAMNSCTSESVHVGSAHARKFCT